jgi:FkbM family methyltransferase
MRDLSRTLISVLIGIRRIWSLSHRQQGFRLSVTYVKLQFKSLLAKWFGINYNSESFLGFKVEVLGYSSFVYLFEEIFVYQIYHFNSQTYSNRAAPIILDGGSNIGISVLYYKWLFPNSRILAFEPDPHIFKILKGNVEKNSLKNIDLHNCALAGQNGELDFFYDSDITKSSLVGSTQQSKFLSNKITVHAKKLSEYITTEIDFLKLDVEGSEADVLKDLEDAQKLKFIRHIYLECHHNLNSNALLEKSISTLSHAGFAFQIGANDLIPRDIHDGNFGIQQDIMIYAQNQKMMTLPV